MTRIAPALRPIIGWNEYVDLPDWGVSHLRAKIDTGARSSALHVADVELRSRGRVRFDIVLDTRKRRRRKRVEVAVSRRARVRSSTGEYSTRIFVSTSLRLGPVEREAEISLVDRGDMIFRMLIGRTALGHDFLIDAARNRLLGRSRRKPHASRKGSFR